MGGFRDPEGESARQVRILSVPEQVPVTVCFLGGYRGVSAHWIKKISAKGGKPKWVSHPCLGEMRCPPFIHREKTCWKGYAPVEHWEHQTKLWIPFVLEITESLEHVLRGRQLRGESWMLSRRLVEGKGPVVGIFSNRLPEEELSPEFDILPILERAWHEKDFLIDVPNPVKPMVMIQPRRGEEPTLVGEMLAQLPAEQPVDPAVREKMKEQLREAMKSMRGGKNGKG
jgi:hypothetical protein